MRVRVRVRVRARVRVRVRVRDLQPPEQAPVGGTIVHQQLLRALIREEDAVAYGDVWPKGQVVSSSRKDPGVQVRAHAWPTGLQPLVLAEHNCGA